MKDKRLKLKAAGLILFLALLPNAASARVSFGIGFGTSFGHRHSDFHIGCSPYYGFHGSYYWRPGRGHFGHRDFYRHKPWRSSGVSLWIEGLFPIVIEPPVIVRSPKVTTERHVVIKEQERQIKPEGDKETDKLFEKLRRRKSELLKILRTGDEAKRKEAIRELAGFSFDNKVRESLEDVLLNDPDPEMRRLVAESFGKTTNKKVLAALEKAKADDPSIEVRQEASEAIIKIKGHKL